MKKNLTRVNVAIREFLTLFCIVFIINISNSFARDTKFENISIQDGLSHNNVNCIFQDSRGFLWIGTKDGLNRYDGYNIISFYSRQKDSATLSNNFIQAICEAPDSTGIWVGTRNGLNFYHFGQEKFSRYLMKNDFSNSKKSNGNITSLVSGYKGRIWIGTDYGLKKLVLGNSKNRTLISFEDLSKAEFDEIGDKANIPLPMKKITCLFKCKDGGLWVCFASGELFRLKEKQTGMEITPFQDCKKYVIKGIVEDIYGNLWLATNKNGIVKQNKETGQFITIDKEMYSGLESNSYNSICKGNSGEIWLATKNYGLAELTYENQSFVEKSDSFIKVTPYTDLPGTVNSMSEYTVRCVFMDRTGVLWVGTRGNGIVKITFHPNYFRNYKFLDYPYKRWLLKEINSIVEDRNGNFWIGSKNGVSSYNRTNNKFSYYRNRKGEINRSTYRDVFSICEDQTGNMWFGTNGGGLDRYNPDKLEFTHLIVENCNLNSNYITSIVSLASGDLLIGTVKGRIDLIKRDELKKEVPKVIPFPLGLKRKKNSFANSRKIVYEDGLGEIWVTTSLDGVYRFNPKNKKLVHYNHDQGNLKTLPTDHITAVYEDESGVIWLGSTKGLVRFNRNSDEFDLYAMKDGFPDHSIIGIIGDNIGNLWVLTRNWISRFNLQTKRVRSFKIQHRVSDELFTHNPLWKTQEGEIFVGTQTEGYFSFFPDSIEDVSFLPQIAITDLKISGESVRINEEGELPFIPESINSIDEIEMKYYQNNLSFEFASLSYLLPESQQYACILEGAQAEWQYMDGNRRLVNFFNLAPGEYIFRVKASNCDGLWNSQGKSITINVLPPWWKTWWAYSLYIIVITCLFIALYRYTYEWIALKNRLVFEQMEKKKMRELNQVKLRFFTNISHEFRTPLTLILGPLERLLASGGSNSSIEKHYVLMHKNASRLLRLINQLMDFRKTENKQMKLHARKSNISSFISEVMQSFEDLAQEKQISFEMKSDSNSILLWFDRDKMDKIMFNLLSNAFKFTPKGGNISIDIRSSESSGTDAYANGRLEIKLTDSGRGMTTEQVEKIFDRFYQGEHDQTGTGIGLSLTRSLVELHRGEIYVSSEKGKGSCFRIALPLGKEHLKDEEISLEQSDFPERQEEFTVKRILDLNADEMRSTADQLDEQKKIVSNEAPLILIVEDNDSLRTFIRENLEQEYRIMEAENGKEAYAKVMETEPDLIISDVMMPEMNGLELCRAIKTDSRISHVPIILLTALDTVKDQLTGYKMGADDYISKPFNPSLLDVRVKNLIQIRMGLKKRFQIEISLEPRDITIASPDEKLLVKAMKVIEENLSDPDFTVEKLSEEIGMSRVHLYRKIKALTDQTATEFIRTIRLKQAAKLLLQKKLTVSEICFLVGFKNPVSFGRSFKTHFGETPTDYVANYSNSKESIT